MENLNDIVALETRRLHINDIVDTVLSANCGAVSTFIGTTRDNFEQKKVLKLEYEAYEPMALKEMRTVCEKVRRQWNVEKIAIYHRLGEVPVMEPSVVIAISSIHRQEALQAVQFTIDAVKSSVPIWKKEIYENDEPQWKANKECFWTNYKSIKVEKNDELREGNELYNDSNVKDEINIDIDNVYETVEVKSEFVNENSSDTCDSNSNEDFIIDPDQIQIKADCEELNRRIESFILRKREQVNIMNIQEFCTYSNQIQDDNDESTCVCARVNAVLMRRKDSKTHIKVHRVYNQWSQQNIKSDNRLWREQLLNYSPAVNERLSTTEKILGINKPVPQNIYERIKKIEDRLLFLESISPEYKDLWTIDDCDSVNSFNGGFNSKFNDNINSKSLRKRTYSSTEFDSKSDELEDRYGNSIK